MVVDSRMLVDQQCRACMFATYTHEVTAEVCVYMHTCVPMHMIMP